MFKRWQQHKRWRRYKHETTTASGSSTLSRVTVASGVQANTTHVANVLASDDLVRRELPQAAVPCSLLYIDNLVEEGSVYDFIISPLTSYQPQKREKVTSEQFIARVEVSSIERHTHMDKVIEALLTGQVVLFLEGSSTAYTLAVAGGKKRNVEEPASQLVIHGPREGFVEVLAVNTALIRAKVRHPDVRVKKMTVGKVTRTKIAVVYMAHVVNRDVLSEVLRRLENVTANKILDSGMLGELIGERKYTPFPTIQSTERPDVAAADVSDGRVVIVVDGSPFALIAPATFISFFQAAEDYYERFDLATFIRIIRVIAFAIALGLPALYIAVTTFHQELIPTDLLISLLAQREGVPFPAFLEALLMETIFEILREAGIRMPRPIGPAVSIVGAIVIGESAVRAGLVSSAIVIVVSLTAIASFIAPYYSFGGTIRMLRFLLMVLAATAGLFGMAVFFVALLIHLCALQSMGQPYFAPIAPFDWLQQKDTLFRFPLRWSKTSLYKKLSNRAKSNR